VTPRLRSEFLPEVYGDGYWNSNSPKDRGYADYRREAPLYIKTFEKRMKLLEQHGLKPGKALDVGCAAGFFLDVLKRRGWDVHGVELSPAIAKHAQQEFELGDRVFVGSLDECPHEDNTFDLITMWDVVEHVEDPVPFLAKAVELLADDGYLILETQNVESRFARMLGTKWQHYKHLEHLYHFSPKTIEKLLDRVGLEIVDRTPRYGGKHVSLGFVRERATRVHPAMRYLLAPLVPLSGVSFYVNLRDEMVVVARKKR